MPQPTPTYTIHIEPATEGGFSVAVQAWPGCRTQADTFEDALDDAKECIQRHLDSLAKTGQPIPLESAIARPLCLAVQVTPPQCK